MWKRLVSALTNLSTGNSLWGQLSGVGGILAGGAVMGWAAWASAWLRSYGPIAYVGIGFATVVILTFTAAIVARLIAGVRARLASAEFHRSLAARKEGI